MTPSDDSLLLLGPVSRKQRRPTRPRRPIASAEIPRHLRVVLVHGTFAKRAGWLQEASALLVRLREQLGPHDEILRFPWTGSNSERGRGRAALELCAFLTEARSRDPEAYFVLI